MNLLGYAACTVVVPTTLLAQNTDAGTFLTFNEAVDQIIAPGQDLFGCPGFDQDGDGIFYDADAVFFTGTLPDGWDDLSPALQAQCARENNGIGGATLGGGFGGPFSTRTFLPLIVDTNRPDGNDATSIVGRLDTGFAYFQMPHGDGGARLGFGVSGSLVETETTDYGIGQGGHTIEAFFTYTWELSELTLGGFAFDVGRTSTESGTVFDFSGTTIFRGLDESDPSFVQQTLDNAEPVCNALGDAEQDTQGFGITAFVQHNLSGAASLLLEGRLGRDYNVLSSPACTYRVGEAVDQDVFFAGVIESDYAQTTFDLAITLLTQRPLLGGTLVPRIGLASQLTDIPGYTQTEQSAGDVTIETVTADAMNDPVFGTITTQDTGLALVFEDSQQLSVIAEIGVALYVPMQSGTLSLDVGLFNRLLDERTVTASFAGDRRSDPTTFSFDTSPSDDTYVEAGVGYGIGLEEDWTAQIGASVLLWDSFEDQASLSLALERAF